MNTSLLVFFRILWDSITSMRITRTDIIAGIGMIPGITMNTILDLDFAQWEKLIGLVIAVMIGIPTLALKWIELRDVFRGKLIARKKREETNLQKTKGTKEKPGQSSDYSG